MHRERRTMKRHRLDTSQAQSYRERARRRRARNEELHRDRIGPTVADFLLVFVVYALLVALAMEAK